MIRLDSELTHFKHIRMSTLTMIIRHLLLSGVLLLLCSALHAQPLSTAPDTTKSVAVRKFLYRPGGMSIQLPENWFQQTSSTEQTATMMVSREQIKGENDRTQVGVMISRLRELGRAPNGRKADSGIYMNLIRIISTTPSGAFHKAVVVSSRDIHISEYSGVIAEMETQVAADHPVYRMYQINLSQGIDLISITMEAPVGEFESYRAVFDDCLKTLKLE